MCILFTGMLKLNVVRDDIVEVYNETNDVIAVTGYYTTVYSVTLENPCVLALYGWSDYGANGIMASSSSGDVVTNLEWKCSDVYEEGWSSLVFNDAHWENAVRATGYDS